MYIPCNEYSIYCIQRNIIGVNLIKIIEYYIVIIFYITHSVSIV